MAEPSLEDGVNELRNPESVTAQLFALKHLRNHAIGHLEKKQRIVQLGVVEALENILSSSARARGKRRTQEINGSGAAREHEQAWSEDDEVHLHAIALLGSLAHGGSEFASPIFETCVVPTLISYLKPGENPPKTVLTGLKTLNALADSRALETLDSIVPPSSPLDSLYSKTAVQILAEILSQKPTSPTVQNHTRLAYQLIAKTISTDQQRHALVSAGILDHLAEKIAACFVHERIYKGRANPQAAATLPRPPLLQTLPHVISAITSIVSGSRYRIARLLYNPLILDAFPLHHPSLYAEPAVPGNSYLGSSNGWPVDVSLPWIYGGSYKNDNGFSKAFPALGSLQATNKQSLMNNLGEERTNGVADKSHIKGLESAVIPWLMHAMRFDQRLCRVEAARLLAALYQAGFVGKNRALVFSLLVLPLLVDLTDELPSPLPASPGTASQDIEDRTIREQVPRILAGLLTDFPHLQKVAAEAGVVKKVCQLLKSTFHTVDIRPGIWSSSPPIENLGSLSPSCRLGPRTLPLGVVHAMRCRESALILVAAISEREDKYRKHLNEQDLVPRLIDSLVPLNQNFLTKFRGHGSQEKLDANVGNPISVVLAACKAARSMSRSVGLLRTSLIDAGLVTPVEKLLKHPNIELVIAATDVICNIITDFSPMRAALLEAGVVNVLCEHAHSTDSRVRMGSLWALKHFVQQCPNEFKIKCFEELGTGWLPQVITGSSSLTNSVGGRNLPNTHPSIGAAANAAGERVDILNATEDETMTDDPPTASQPALEASKATSLQSPNSSTENPSTSMIDQPYPSDARVQAIKAAEDLEAAHMATNSDLLIQVQGMDILRNLIEGPGAIDMIEFLFNTLGAQRVFDLIASKLRASSASCPPTSLPGNSNTDPLSPTLGNCGPLPTALINSALFTAVHIAAGAPRHRVLLIQQTPLLQAIPPLFSHPDPGIRVTCCWLVNNLIWVDDAGDAVSARQRAVQLQTLGFVSRLREAKADDALDVRERAVTAWDNMARLTEGGQSALSGPTSSGGGR